MENQAAGSNLAWIVVHSTNDAILPGQQGDIGTHAGFMLRPGSCIYCKHLSRRFHEEHLVAAP